MLSLLWLLLDYYLWMLWAKHFVWAQRQATTSADIEFAIYQGDRCLFRIIQTNLNLLRSCEVEAYSAMRM